MINQFLKQLGTGIEQAAETLGKLPTEEIQAQLHQVARNTLTKMDLVTREEFDVQVAMLTKYRERLMALEARITELETPAPLAKKTPVKRAPAVKKASVAKKEPAVKKTPVRKTATKAVTPKSVVPTKTEPKE